MILRLLWAIPTLAIGEKKKRMSKSDFNAMICRFAAMRRFLRLAGGAAAKKVSKEEADFVLT
ncbi:hypothetical protein [Telmatospirillum siberiense]|uniref:hypothetical protein n=1 Tax=Telmatospirillum siberiense TaxID=382514 RepID=UPI0011AECCB2|nr:hypothetical protein [Telmatospirillum siberiense]